MCDHKPLIQEDCVCSEHFRELTDAVKRNAQDDNDCDVGHDCQDEQSFIEQLGAVESREQNRNRREEEDCQAEDKNHDLAPLQLLRDLLTLHTEDQFEDARDSEVGRCKKPVLRHVEKWSDRTKETEIESVSKVEVCVRRESIIVPSSFQIADVANNVNEVAKPNHGHLQPNDRGGTLEFDLVDCNEWDQNHVEAVNC